MPYALSAGVSRHFFAPFLLQWMIGEKRRGEMSICDEYFRELLILREL
jgi:hypothetical protein